MGLGLNVLVLAVRIKTAGLFELSEVKLRCFDAGELSKSLLVFITGGVWCLMLPTRKFLSKDLNAGDELPELLGTALLLALLAVFVGMGIGGVDDEEIE